MIAFDLLSKRLGFNRDTGRDASKVVRQAARRAKIPAEAVGTVRGANWWAFNVPAVMANPL